jgi:hypothetical protein
MLRNSHVITFIRVGGNISIKLIFKVFNLQTKCTDYKNGHVNTTYIGLSITFETDLHVFIHHFSIVYKIIFLKSEACDEWITEDSDHVCYVVRLEQLIAVMTDLNKIS